MDSSETPAPSPAQPAADAPAPAEESRRAFSPVLVFMTVAVVLFVLWFCPKAISWAWNQGAPAAVEK